MKKIIFILIFCLLFNGCNKKNYSKANGLKFDYSEQIQKDVNLQEFAMNFLSMGNKLEYKCDLPIFVENNGDCGYIQVPKDYEDRNKGYYKLFWYVFKASNKENKKDPIILLPGGPGISGTIRADVILNTGISELRENHDIYSIDYRGVGLSDPYSKEIYENCEYVNWLGDKKDSLLNTVNNCKKYLNTNDDVYFGINNETVGKDIVQFLENKNIDKAILYGQSAGTTVALLSARISSERISGLVLDGTISYEMSGENLLLDALLFGISEFLKSYEKNKNLIPKEFSDFNKRIISLSKKSNEENKEFAYKVLRTISIFSQDKYRFIIADKVLTMFENNDMESFSNFSKNISIKYNKDYQENLFGSEYEWALFFYHPQGIYFVNKIWNRAMNKEEHVKLVDTKKLDEKILNFIGNYNGNDFMVLLKKVKEIMKFSYLPFDEKYDIEKINVPTLILSGTRDFQTPVPWATFVDSKLNNSKQFILQNGVHVLTRVNDCGVELMRKFSLNPEDIQNVEDSCVSETNDFHNDISFDVLTFEKLLEY